MRFTQAAYKIKDKAVRCGVEKQPARGQALRSLYDNKEDKQRHNRENCSTECQRALKLWDKSAVIRLEYCCRATSAWNWDIMAALRCRVRLPVNMGDADHLRADGKSDTPRQKPDADGDTHHQGDQEKDELKGEDDNGMMNKAEAAERDATDNKENSKKRNVDHETRQDSKKQSVLKPQASSP